MFDIRAWNNENAATGAGRSQHLRVFDKNITSLSFPNSTRTDYNKEIPLSRADTSIVILSSLIPTHPAITMINDTFNSLSMLEGLPSNTPIFISVDGLRAQDLNTNNLEKLQNYTENLRERFQENPHVAILNNPSFGHLSNGIRRALKMVNTEFVYIIQHDFKFIKHVNHRLLLKSMREYPGELQIVRFSKRPTTAGYVRPDCRKVVEYNGIRFTSGRWSDNNHLTTKRYYDEHLKIIGPKSRPVEAPMMRGATTAGTNCTTYHPYVYSQELGPFLAHLDGRNTKPVSSATEVEVLD